MDDGACVMNAWVVLFVALAVLGVVICWRGF